MFCCVYAAVLTKHMSKGTFPNAVGYLMYFNIIIFALLTSSTLTF